MSAVRRALFGAALLLASSLVPTACSRGPRDPVLGLLEALKDAGEARDAEKLGERLSAQFRGPSGQGRAEVLAEARRWFALYERVGLQLYEPEVEREGDAARVRVVVGFQGEARKIGPLANLLPPSAVYRFTMDVAAEEGGWRVRSASWEPVEASPQPAPQP